MKKQTWQYLLIVILTVGVISIGFLISDLFSSSDYSYYVANSEYKIKASTIDDQLHSDQTLYSDSTAMVENKREPNQVMPKMKIIRPRNIQIESEVDDIIDIDTRNLDLIISPNSSVHKVKNYWAIKKEDYIPQDFKVVGERTTFYIVVSDFKPEGALPIVVTDGSKTVGILTGVLTVKFKDYDAGINWATDEQIEIVTELEHLSTLLLKVDGYDASMSLYEYLSHDPNTEQVELEILKGVRRSK